MEIFIEKPANINSYSRRKLVCGKGVNDSSYIVRYFKDSGGQIECPYYTIWRAMVSRCYNKKSHEVQPTYVECSVSPEWLYFSVFRSWMKTQNWKGKNLDKDIIIPGNKVYSKEGCAFVTREVNNLIIYQRKNKSSKDSLPLGVVFKVHAKKFQAQYSINGKNTHIGYYHTAKDASRAYVNARAAYIIEIAATQSERIKVGLIKHAELLLKGDK